MITDVVQRWRGGRASYELAGAPINTRLYEVAPIDGKGADNTARAFIAANHYAKSMPAARERIGLYRAGELVGLAVYSMPSQVKVLDHLPCPRAVAVELGRLVLLHGVEANGESWFIARAHEIMRARGYEGVISHADPVERMNLAGERVKPGHVGLVYQATNAVYRGLATARTLRLMPDGRVFNNRTMSKIRARERGWRAAVDELVAIGATPPERTDTAHDLHAWLLLELPRVTRPLKHGGNYRYLIGLTPTLRRHLPKSLPYPKVAR